MKQKIKLKDLTREQFKKWYEVNKNQEVVIEIELLTKKEKEYLEGVIRPFKDEIEYITKYYKDEYNPKEYIYLSIKDAFPTCLPEFEANKYYKGLERTKRYTLKDLGLFKE